MEDRDSNRERQVLQYYVAKQDTMLTRISGACSTNLSTLRLGMLVEALEDMKEGMLRICVVDTIADSKMWCGTEWRCHRYDLVLVPQKIWQCLLAVQSLQERVELAKDEVLCERLRNISINDKVWYSDPDPLNKRVREIAFIRYVGPVTQLGLGHYFGLELLENQEVSKTAALAKEYFIPTHWNATVTFATINNIYPYKIETDTISSNIEKALFLKTNVGGADYVNDKKKSILDSTPTVLVENFTMFDDNKNNNHESVNVLKERHQVAKSSFENDVNNYAKSVDQTLFKCGNLTIVNTINIFILSVLLPQKNLGTASISTKL